MEELAKAIIEAAMETTLEQAGFLKEYVEKEDAVQKQG